MNNKIPVSLKFKIALVVTAIYDMLTLTSIGEIIRLNLSVIIIATIINAIALRYLWDLNKMSEYLKGSILTIMVWEAPFNFLILIAGYFMV